MNFEEYRAEVLSALGVTDEVNVRYFEDFRKAILTKYGVSYSAEDLRNEAKYRQKLLTALGITGDINIHNFVDYRTAVLTALGVEFTVDDLRNEDNFEAKAIEGLQGSSEEWWSAGEGLNKMPYPQARDVTFKGVHFVSDGKGTITLKGSCTGNDYAAFLTDPFTIPDGSEYKICFLNTQSLGEATAVGFYNGSTSIDTWIVNKINKETNYAAMSGKRCDRVLVYCKSGINYDCRLQIMFVPTDTEVTEYIPYEKLKP